MRRPVPGARFGAIDCELIVHRGRGPGHAALLVVPGARCRADRYDWLGALAGDGLDVSILDGLLSHPPAVFPAGPSPTILQLCATLALIGRSYRAVHLVGHSAGAATILDAFDPAGNTFAKLPEGFALPIVPASTTILGCSLQAHMLGAALPHRSDDRPLHRPARTRLQFIAGAQDAVATPELVARTAARYTPPAAFTVLPNATHYGWAGPREDGDDPRFDRVLDLDTARQRAVTLDNLHAFLAAG